MLRRRIVKKDLLIIFVKYPEAGFVKTRLGKSIGEDGAAELHRLFVEAVLKRTEDSSFKRAIFFYPPDREKELQKWLGSGIDIYPQRGGNLGVKLSSAFEWGFEKDAKSVIVIGTDNPVINKTVILKAFKELESKECVIGPALDGGYYLLGLSSLHKELFQAIPWSTNKVFDETLRILNNLSLKYAFLDNALDIDSEEDLIMLKELLRKDKALDFTGLVPIIERLDEIAA